MILMVDIETLSTAGNALILQVGAVKFSVSDGVLQLHEQFEKQISYQSSMALGGFDVDDDTIKWWKNQSKNARDAVSLNGENIKTVIQEFCAFAKDASEVWCHNTFDAPILGNAIKRCGLNLPFKYTNWRDIRTLTALANMSKHEVFSESRGGTHHTALDDCLYQINYCVRAMNKLKS